MQDYRALAKKNGITLLETGSCQFCGAQTTRGVHECLELFNLGFPQLDYSQKENHRYRFLTVDTHILQHAEIHGRWSNHLHLCRLHLMFTYKVYWQYNLTPKLSDYLNAYKVQNKDEFLISPPISERGKITILDVVKNAKTKNTCQQWIEDWAIAVYQSWQTSHPMVDGIAQGFMDKNKGHFTSLR